MTLAQKGWVLIGLGAADLLGWMGTGLGWTNWIFGDNVLTKYGPAALIALGLFMLRAGSAQQTALAEEACEDAHLPTDETVIHREASMASVLTITSRRLRFKGGAHMDSVRNAAKDCPPTDSGSWCYEDIEGIQVLQSSDVLASGMAQNISAVAADFLPKSWTLWGVGLRLKDGTKVNIPCGSPIIVAQYLEKRLLNP
jgi:hypothetical protein